MREENYKAKIVWSLRLIQCKEHKGRAVWKNERKAGREKDMLRLGTAQR